MAANHESRALMIFLNNRVLLEALGDAERGRLTMALLNYLEFGALPDFEGELRLAFLVLRQDVDRSVQRWEEECARRSAAGKKSAAVRAAKNFRDDVSCENDSASDKEGSALPNDTDARSTALNSVENSSTAATYTNQNQNQTPNSNQNPNTNTNTNPNETQTPGASAAFERFWSRYPRKVGKAAARKAFARVSVPVDRLLESLERQRGDPQWQRENGRFIPHPVTWLNQARWEDEPPEASKPDCGVYGVECL